MHVGIEIKDKDVYTIIQILNSRLGEEVKLEEILVELLKRGGSSSDLLFLILQKLEKNGFVKGVRGVLKIERKIEKGYAEKIKREIKKKFQNYRKLFVTPLEVAKFYQCPRRLFLEKVVLAKQYKEAKGRTWDGEVVHLAVNLFIKNLLKKPVEELVQESIKISMKKYEGKITINEEDLKDFLFRFYELLREENFKKIFTEKTFESFKHGLTGTPDLVGIKENSIIPIDLKLGRISRRGVKEEHILQNVGESILIEDFFRKSVDTAYLIYFGSRSLVKLEISEELKKKFLSYKKQIERMCRIGKIPEKGKLPNLKRRVCLGCHVRPSCENIEMLRRIGF